MGTRFFGTLGIVAAVLFIPSFFLGAHPTGAADFVNSLCMIVAMVGFATLYLGYRHTRVAGPGRLASVSLLLLAIGHLCILLGALALTALGIDDGGDSPATLIFPVGGLLILVNGILAGIAVARARILPGWRRWGLLVTGFVYVLVTASQIAAGEDPSFAANAIGVIWPLSVLLNAFALVGAGDRRPAAQPILTPAPAEDRG